MSELSKTYEAAEVEPDIYQQWLDQKAFRATPDDRDGRYVVMMPLPNVTGALHMGHALNNTMQDLLIRWHRMRGDNTLWMAGTDHAGIATQAVVEKRLKELEGLTRHDIGREALVERIWKWKDEYQKRIVSQQQRMGCSCDWDRQRFTMDPVCARAVRWTFLSMFRDGLIYRGTRLVNWDCHLHTAVSDDELYTETKNGHFWHLRYPVIDPGDGEPEHIVVATTRPETMLGDTAVACHPEPRAALTKAIADAEAKLAAAPAKEREAAGEEVERLQARVDSHLPLLEKLAAMAAAGARIRLPLVDREIPLIADVWAKPELGSGCVKITPGHDPNDYEVWTRHKDAIDIRNILNQDGTINADGGAYAGLDRFAARDRVVADLDAQGLLERVEDRVVEIKHSDRSKTAVEPYLSLQWFLNMGDVPGGVVLGRGTGRETTVPGLAQVAIDATSDDWSSPSGRRVTFHPDARYKRTYNAWLEEKRDWCISRQLWWGHQIAIWSRRAAGAELAQVVAALRPLTGRDDLAVRVVYGETTNILLSPDAEPELPAEAEVQLCLRDDALADELSDLLTRLELIRSTDVLDTWFSSGLWPHSTLGWPDPQTAAVDDGQLPLGADGDRASALDYYYPGSCLITGRDIITLWVARMVMMGLYNLGDLPFTDVFIHASIQDGKGVRMSKSKGNGIDPVDIIDRYGTDALRYVLCEMQTGSQDIRLPVQVNSPFTDKQLELADLEHGKNDDGSERIFSYLDPDTGKEFDVVGMMPDLPSATPYSDRFEVGRNFCTKLWNAARFALMNLEGATFEPRALGDLELEDRWILSRLEQARAAVDRELAAYNPSAAIGAVREFFWSELCDWYLELVKPRMRDPERAPMARQVLAVALDQVLRLLHPFVPFITETLWAKLNETAPERGLGEPLAIPAQLVLAPWPGARAELADPAIEERIGFMQEVVGAMRELRARYDVPPKQLVAVLVRAPVERAEAFAGLEGLMRHMAGVESLTVAPDAKRTPDSATGVVRDIEIYLQGVVDLDKERARLDKRKLKLEKELGGVQKKLGNAGFLAKAAPEVVDKQRARLADLEAELAGIERGLAML